MMRSPGFTLLELLLAVTLTAMVMVSSMTVVNLFTAADRAAITGYELDTEVQRALRLLEDDAREAVSISTGVRRIEFERADGKFVVWLRPTGDAELLRLLGDSRLEVDVAAAGLLGGLPPPEFDARGRLRDGSYRESAVLQGEHAFSLQMVTSARNDAVIGIQVAITTAAGERRSRRSMTACSARLVEANCKPPITPSAATTSGSTTSGSTSSGSTSSGETSSGTTSSGTTNTRSKNDNKK